MPKKSAKDQAAPRRRGARAAAIDIETERNLVMRVLLHSPKDTLAGLVAVAAIAAIVANALFLQTGRHPAPMFGTVINLPAPSTVPLPNPLPRPRPVGADTSPLEPKATEFRVEPKPVEKAAEKPVEATASTPRSGGDPMTNLVKATTSTPPSVAVARPPAPIPVQQSPAARRIAGVQRALSEYGYGNLKVTGTMSGETQSAIQTFERQRKMPVTGQVSDRLLRELGTAIGHPVE
ncbi:peptidoglycan-binding protein [Bradyrhizobium diazoefficiens]|nr:peptidoglycan-binding domain-containing protein [Bradyrhizobium diazoefficiens]MBR0966805.1 peptidoglycan-binding protein [Bradyrhizobium diazoefficiens]MBR0980443.1 peptidoglycan-binding protein [Bradyrhizobium diazoefficiens]MBR1009791.1 peptidoglycan-binding protein [Bradyrhizobium diazoefficiens]MBR1016374.1 peptidoglycan-binding protein [Bradyrhizobium diazoefficiens]MBR1051484.1 peptidoglycan-binding protein [Bradyrhizobium diazoefficiens]